VRVVLGWYRRRARRAGFADGHSGSVTVIQRFAFAKKGLHVAYLPVRCNGGLGSEAAR
jgi:hypothetical protein